MLGEFGGVIGRSSEAGKDAGLWEKGEEDFLNFGKETGEVSGVGMVWDLGFSPGC